MCDRDSDDLSGRAEAGDIDDLVVTRPAAHAARIGSRRTLDEHVESPTHKTLCALMSGPLDDLDEALHPRDLDLVGDLVRQRRGVGAAPRRVEESERPVVSDLLGDLEGLLEVVLGLAREAD